LGVPKKRKRNEPEWIPHSGMGVLEERIGRNKQLRQKMKENAPNKKETKRETGCV